MLMGAVAATLVHTTMRNDRLANARDQQAVILALKARMNEMGRALTGLTAGREEEVLEDLAAGRHEGLRALISRPLHEGFGFEYTFVVDARGQLIYASGTGQQDTAAAFEWIHPAVKRALAEPPGQARAGFVVTPQRAGLLAARPFSATSADLPSAQPLILVTVDLVDENLLSELFGLAHLGTVQLVRDAVDGHQNTVALPNLADGSQVHLAWPAEQPGRGFLLKVVPLVAIAAIGLCLVFLALLLRARRTAAALTVSEARARELAHQDSLTGLANRNRFIMELGEALKAGGEGRTLALLFMDLDGFKEVNDSLGHAAGDELLCVVARRLRGCLGVRGLAARFGGDEFVLFLRDVDEAELASFVASLYGVLAIPIIAGGKDLTISASVGAARAPQDARTTDELMSLADVALYRAKADGRGSYRLFEPSFERERLERRRTEAELTVALEKGELKLVFQPQVDVETERVVGFETLVRWDHPTRGRILPGEFVPIAEGSRLISRLDSYVLRHACEQARQLPDVTISVNMSPFNMRHAGMVDDILTTLRQTEFDPRRLEIEITESAILDASAEGQDSLQRLREMGVRLALDDFGTGHASLVHVRRFPITKIKIDKSFILNLGVQRDAASIVEYVVRLGRSLGITLTAEGVETREQLRFLRAFGAHQAQGYLFAPPLPLAGAVALLERQRLDDRQRSARAVPSEEPRRPEEPAQ